MDGNSVGPVSIIGSYVPRRCGIATFSHDLAAALADHVYGHPLGTTKDVSIVPVNDREDGYPYGPEVHHSFQQHAKTDYRDAADFLNSSKAEIISLQHEYGLFGGQDGEYLLALADRLKKPVVSTLHTVLTDPSPTQLSVLQRLCRTSSAVVVMAERARRILTDTYQVDPEIIHLIHHGVPEIPLSDPEPFKKRLQVEGRPTIVTFGLLGPSKGIEMMLLALSQIVEKHKNVAYLILGVTHPQVKRESGESYRLSLEGMAEKLNVQDNVIFHNRYASPEDLCEFLQAADLYVTPYRSKEQITSGTLAQAVAGGKAIISTPYWYAQEMLADGRGRLVEFGDADGMARALDELLTDHRKREAMGRRCYEFGRQMTWPNVARAYATVFKQARARFAERRAPMVERRKPRLRLSLPEARYDHLFRMTDDVGLVQHAVFSTPDRRHGYAADDQARALIVTAMAWSLFQDEQVLPYYHVYLSYVHHAQSESAGKCHNFMSFDRRWLDDEGSDDCQGRVLWALGHSVDHPPDSSARSLAELLFRETIPHLEWVGAARASAFAVLGCHYYLRKYPEEQLVRDALNTLADRINDEFVANEASDWPWFEDVATYDNGRMPQALLLAGMALDRDDMVERGLRVLDWLLRVQTSSEGCLSLIGCHGWMQQNGSRAQFAQQALDAAALVEACKAAYRATEDERYLFEMRRCFAWFLGHNDLGRPLIDFKTRGCLDGLEAEGVSENQGAESIVSWLLALLTMHEMQSGEIQEPGRRSEPSHSR